MSGLLVDGFCSVLAKPAGMGSVIEGHYSRDLLKVSGRAG